MPYAEAATPKIMPLRFNTATLQDLPWPLPPGSSPCCSDQPAGGAGRVTWHLLLRAEALGAVGVGAGSIGMGSGGGGGGVVDAGLPQAGQHPVQHVQAGGAGTPGTPGTPAGRAPATLRRPPPCHLSSAHMRICIRDEL